MKVKEYVKFLNELDQELDINLLGPDCGGYDIENVEVTPDTICIFEHRNELFLGNKNIVNIWKPVIIK